MNSAMASFLAELDNRDVKYSVLDEETVSIKFNNPYDHVYDVNYTFGEDGKDVTIRVFSIATIPSEKLAKAYEMCSGFNAKYRWVKFYVDSDNEVTAQEDAVIESNTVGDECRKLLGSMLAILDAAYPEIMKMLWGGSGVAAPQKK